MGQKRGWTPHESSGTQRTGKDQTNNKKARISYDQSHPSRPTDIFDIYNNGQKQLEKKHQQAKGPDPSDTPEAPPLDRVALFVQLSYELVHDPSFTKEFTKVAGQQTTTAATALAKQLESEKEILSGISKERLRVPHHRIESRKCPTLAAWFDHYPDRLPALPPIRDPEMEAKVFTAASSLAQTHGMPGPSYERLEWLGDAYLELITRRIIFHIFTDTFEALAATITQDFVRNENLARIALAYGFDDRLQLSTKHLANTAGSARKSMVKVYGDVFEAYVAAVIESDPETGYQTAYHWLAALIKPTILKYKQKVPFNPEAKVELSKRVLGKGIKIEWEESKPSLEVKGGRVFYYSAYLHGWGYKKQLLGSGEGPGKSQAQGMAAMEALINPTTAVIFAIKKEYDALVKSEREKEGGPDPEVIAALDKKYKQIPVE